MARGLTIYQMKGIAMKPIDRQLRQALSECIQAMDSGDDLESCLERYPGRADEMRRHLQLWLDLRASAKPEPNQESVRQGQQRLLATLDGDRGRERRMAPFLTATALRAAAALAGVALLVGGAAGASAALGGPDVTDEVLSTVGIDNAPDAAEQVKACASENAWDGSGNAEDGAANADAAHGSPDCQANDDEHGGGLDNASENADDHASDGLDTAEEATDSGLNVAGEHANDNAADGLGKAEDAAGGSGDQGNQADDGEDGPGNPGDPNEVDD